MLAFVSPSAPVRHRDLLHRGPQTSLALRQVHNSRIRSLSRSYTHLAAAGNTHTPNRNTDQPSEEDTMRVLCALFCGLILAVTIVNCNPIDKREAEEDLNPLNEVYVIEADDAADAADGEKGRDKRKIVGVKLGISNGILNFVFDKVDSFIDSKTKALAALDESNKAKNHAFGIDNKHSATTEFLNHLVSQKIQAATGSIGPIINSATTFFSGVTGGLTKALASKIAPLSSLSGGGHPGGAGGTGTDGSGGSSGSALIGNLLTQKIGSLSSLSQSSGGLGSLSGGSSGNAGDGGHSGNGGGGAGAGINLGAFANLPGLG